MQAQQLPSRNTASVDALTAPASQGPATTAPSTEVTFDEWKFGSPRLAAIKEVSTNIAGEIPAYERYVTAKNAELGLDSELYVLRDLSHTPRDFNYYDKVQEALEKRQHGISLAA